MDTAQKRTDGCESSTMTYDLSTLGNFLDRHLQTLPVKQSTVAAYSQTRLHLVKYFGRAAPLGSILPSQAEQWRLYLKEQGNAPSTISRRIGVARQMFRRAIRWKLITENPFASVKMGPQINKMRMF